MPLVRKHNPATTMGKRLLEYCHKSGYSPAPAPAVAEETPETSPVRGLLGERGDRLQTTALLPTPAPPHHCNPGYTLWMGHGMGLLSLGNDTPTLSGKLVILGGKAAHVLLQPPTRTPRISSTLSRLLVFPVLVLKRTQESFLRTVQESSREERGDKLETSSQLLWVLLINNSHY